MLYPLTQPQHVFPIVCYRYQLVREMSVSLRALTRRVILAQGVISIRREQIINILTILLSRARQIRIPDPIPDS